MTTPPDQQIDTLRDQLDSGDRGGTPAECDLLLTFSDRLQLLAEEYSDHRHLKLLRHCTRIAEEVGGLDDALQTRDAAEDIVRWIHDTYDNPETNRDYRVALRMFGKHVADTRDVATTDDGLPESLAWISTKTPRSYDPTPDRAEMLDWDDAEALTDAARNTRDAAMVGLMMDAGPRGGEFFDLAVEDITDADHGLQVRLDGKTGSRTVTLIPGEPYVSRWLADHPGSGTDPLWSHLDAPEPMSRQRIYQSLRALADRADIDKPVTPTNFRKSNASYLAKTGANAALIEERQGRERGSTAVARYVAEFGERGEQTAYAVLHGREVADDSEERRGTVTCQRCDEENPPTDDRCWSCGNALTHEAAREAEVTQQAGLETLAQLLDDDDVDRDEAVEVIDAVIDSRIQAAVDDTHD